MASDGSSDGFAARIEEFMLGHGRRWYRWVVRAVVAFLVVMLLIDAVWLVSDALGAPVFSPAITDTLRTLTTAALTLFLLTGLVQFAVLGRAFERGTEEVAQSADELEQTATEVKEAAEEVEQLSDTVGSETADDETTEELREQTDEIKGEMAGAERTASDIKDKLETQHDPDEPDTDEPDDR